MNLKFGTVKLLRGGKPSDIIAASDAEHSGFGAARGGADLPGERGGYIKKRFLKLQVGFLLAEGIGTARKFPLRFWRRVQVDDDLYLEALAGDLVLTRTREGILAQGALNITQTRECDRCLDEFAYDFDLVLAELFASPPDAAKSVFSVDGSGEIDLAPLLREEALIEASYRAICRQDCPGLIAENGEIGAAAGASAESGEIDPRLAVLKKLLK